VVFFIFAANIHDAMSDQKLPADPNAMILGILSIVLVFGACCCGLTMIPALLMAIFGLVYANKSMKLFQESPENYNLNSFNNIKTARIINIVAVILSGLATLVYLGYFIFYGVAISDILMNDWEDRSFVEELEEDNWDDSIEIIEYEEQDSIIVPADTLMIDSLRID